jgi:hypothetical protein
MTLIGPLANKGTSIACILFGPRISYFIAISPTNLKRTLKLAKMDAPVNMAEEMRFSGKLMACRISFKAGHWYAASHSRLDIGMPQFLWTLRVKMRR